MTLKCLINRSIQSRDKCLRVRLQQITSVSILLALSLGAFVSSLHADTPVSDTSNLTLTATIASKAPPASSPDVVAETIQELLQGLPVTVRVLVSSDGKYNAVVTGNVADEKQQRLIQNIIGNRKVVPNLVSNVIYRFTGIDNEPKIEQDAADKEKEAADQKKKKSEADERDARPVTLVWPLTFSPETVHGTQANASVISEAAERYRIDTLVEALNERYGKKEAPVVRATRNTLLIRAPLRTVLEIKRDLVKLDAPGPQVQLDVWAVQVSGKGKEIQDTVESINEELLKARQRMQLVQSNISRAVRDNQDRIIRLFGTPTGSSRHPNFDALDRIYNLQQEANALKKAADRGEASHKQIEAEIKKIEGALPDLAQEIFKVQDEVTAATSGSVEHTRLKQKLERLRETFKTYSDLFPKLRNLDEQLEELAKQQQEARGQIKIGKEEVKNDSEDWLNLQLLHQLSRTAQFNVEPRRALSLTEVIIFLSVLRIEDRAKIFDDLERRVAKDLFDQVWAAPSDTASNPSAKKPHYSFDLFRKVFVPTDRGEISDKEWRPESYKISVGNFLLALRGYNALDHALSTSDTADLMEPSRREAPEALALQAATIDGFLALAVEALSYDIQKLLLEPLVDELQKSGGNKRLAGKAKGTTLLGRTRLVVTSGLEAGLAPTLTATVNIATPAPITVDEVVKSTGGDTNLKSLFEHLSTPQLALLGTVLKETPPVYADIAPGVGLNVRPTVMPGGSHARLQLNARFGIGTKFPGRPEGRDDITTTQPFDAVQSHHVSTDAIISGLDLFGVSSFNIETRTPRTPFVTPVLGRIPILGAMFRFPRNDTKLIHHSVILVNTIILPRTMDVVRFYGGGDPRETNAGALFVSETRAADAGTSSDDDKERGVSLFIPPN